MKYIFIFLGLILLGHGIYLIFGGEFLRADKFFFLDLFGGIMIYSWYFLVENYQIKPKNVYQANQKRKEHTNLFIVQVCCLLLIVMTLVGVK